MKIPLSILFLLFITTSCQFFETEKISTETFYEEELKTINWNDVDQYPVFASCEQFSDKNEQRDCFSRELISSLSQAAWDSAIGLHQELHDTIWLRIDVSETAELKVREIQIDSALMRTYPLMKQALLDRIDSVKLIAPAYKRGIPVRTEFSLPIVVETESL
ncbi:MAG: hypothetical protein KJO39_11510 [Bacteroidia bacterium]|nr:hypothetical protein [Bacteroidia bacterium]NNF31708.1 hypothetical protein [Flavobacteriaceae bacterium]NNJ83140.1 hypothetical protein [Flavobacteriaceae bacterium]NNK55222.1 hypothetical protein [Flavobacteriaceae bacterium]NNM10217.1 hypothetical protein [Flavobacteriaceae bacterium]